MTSVVAPVRYPLTDHSEHTLSEAIRLADERAADLTVLHVNLYQNGNGVSRAKLKREVEGVFGRIPRTRYVVRRGFLVEETILEEIAAEDADVVVIGHKQLGRWRRTIRRLMDDPDVERYLRQRVDCELVAVRPP